MLLNRVVGASARPLSSLSTLTKAYNALPRLQCAYVACKALQSSSASHSARAYATTTAAKAKKRATTTKKPAAKKKTATKKKAKAAPKPKKKKKVAKKKVVKKRVVSPAAKARKERVLLKAEVKELQVKALTPPDAKPASALTVFTQRNKGTYKGVGALQQLQAAFKALSEVEKDTLEVQAKQNKLANREAYEKWLSSKSAKTIKEANDARSALRHRLTKLYPSRKITGRARGLTKLKDDRLVKRPSNAYTLYFTERSKSGAFASQKTTEAAKLIAAEYKRLGAGEKKKFEDLAAADKTRYTRQYRDAYGEDPPKTVARKTAA